MKNIKVHFSSLSDNWNTPKSIYTKLNKEFKFNFDPCPTDPDFNGLAVEWKERNFINPPYSQISKWIEKGFNEAKEGKLCVFLIPSRTDTKWWHNFVMKAKEIRFIKGRLKFSGHKNSAPFPSCIVIFNGRS